MEKLIKRVAEDTLMFSVRQMCEEDIEFAVQITDTMNWNLTEWDFKFMMSLEPEGCFILLHDSRKIGIATTISFGKVGWIGSVIVDESHRGKGAGSMLVKHAMGYLKSRGVETIGLYSYKENVEFYMRLGFKRETEFTVLKGEPLPSQFQEKSVKVTEKGELQKVIAFDTFHFGASRRKLLEKIANMRGNLCYHYIEEREILGYAMAKVYNHYAEIGPLVCLEGHLEAAEALLKTLLNKLRGFEVSMVVSGKEEKLLKMLLETGFSAEFNVVRMFSKPLAFKDCIYIAESLERG
ncbi:MAG: GNAT family N-acetyltransferase [Candidatus Bathyarchaeia archaeon]|nr:GNAT family N-acetyltransferase [Candidatus Bathyarchaeota archaeon A05DMB-3]